MKKYFGLFAIVLALLAGVAIRAEAQATSGSISGVVSDERGAVIANAAVTARNVGTNETRSTASDSEGRYRFANLAIGNYEVSVEA